MAYYIDNKEYLEDLKASCDNTPIIDLIKKAGIEVLESLEVRPARFSFEEPAFVLLHHEATGRTTGRPSVNFIVLFCWIHFGVRI